MHRRAGRSRRILQGADVINTVMADAHTGGTVLEQVEKIVVIGDPSHRPNRTENVGNWWTLGSANGHGVTMTIANNDTVTFKDANAGLVSSICAIGDLATQPGPRFAWTAVVQQIAVWAFPVACSTADPVRSRADRPIGLVASCRAESSDAG